MKLFTGLKRIRDLQRLQLPFVKSIIDFDIVIEIGYGEEHGRAVTLKRLYLLDLCSQGTMRRKLATLISQGIVIRRTHATDRRASLLVISPGAVKLLGKYCGGLSTISATHFN